MFILYLIFQVDLLITPDFVWKDRFHGSSERWWILVEVIPYFLFNIVFTKFLACICHCQWLDDYLSWLSQFIEPIFT